jgi:hypothetical protein
MAITVARANKRRFLIDTPPSAEHHNERNQIAKSVNGHRRPPRPCHPSRLPMAPPRGHYRPGMTRGARYLGAAGVPKASRHEVAASLVRRDGER